MLLIMSLDWQHFAISEQVVEANHYLQELAQSLGVGNKISFNCASLGAGEFLLPFAEGDLGKNDMPKDDTLDYIRWHHQRVRETMAQNQSFLSNRDLTEMLYNLKQAGHQVAAVLPTRTQHIESQLRDGRIREYFGDNVFGYDRVSKRFLGNVTLASIFSSVIEIKDEDFEDTLVVSDDPDGVGDAVPLETRAVVGYLDPYVPWDEQTTRLKEMDAAGANYTVVGGHYVSALPFFLKGKAEAIAKATLDGLMSRGLGT